MNSPFRKYRKLFIAGIIVLCFAIVVHLFRTGYVLAPYWKLGNLIADWLFNFLSGWAIVLSAAMTLLLAITAFATLMVMSEQRHKSIQPSLQIFKVSRFFQHLLAERSDSEDLTPGVELHINNVGAGPALNLKISAIATIEFSQEDNQGSVLRTQTSKLNFKLPRLAGEYFLERSDESTPFRLFLTVVSKPEPKDNKDIIEIILQFRDMDGSLISDKKLLPMPEDLRRIGGSEAWLFPGDDDYPTQLLTSGQT